MEEVFGLVRRSFGCHFVVLVLPLVLVACHLELEEPLVALVVVVFLPFVVLASYLGLVA
jgi:hypothetical protein